jgi:hypothetical protein
MSIYGSRHPRRRYDSDDNAGDLSIDTSGDLSIGIGGGLGVDMSNGDLTVEVFPGVSIDTGVDLF